MEIDPYKILGVSQTSSLEEIKSAFRSLAKKYHPDKGGDLDKILKINAAWEILRNKKNNQELNQEYSRKRSSINNHDYESRQTSKKHKSESSDKDNEIFSWIKLVYKPIDLLIADVINPFPQKLKELSGDPYDEVLMSSFCIYIDQSQKKLEKVHNIYRSMQTPIAAKHFALNLYQCFSEVQDALNDLERYTYGYVDSYLHDGHEMLRKAKKKRLMLKKEEKYLPIN